MLKKTSLDREYNRALSLIVSETSEVTKESSQTSKQNSIGFVLYKKPNDKCDQVYHEKSSFHQEKKEFD